MSKGPVSFIIPPAVFRLAMRIMPPHRKDWAQAMLNELAYIESGPTAVRWLVGSTLFAIKVRTTYELEKAFMSKRSFKTALVLIAVAVGVVASLYAVQKPYQQERIKFTLHRMLHAKQT